MTSTKASLARRSSKTESKLCWWLFHRRQYCCGRPLLPEDELGIAPTEAAAAEDDDGTETVGETEAPAEAEYDDVVDILRGLQMTETWFMKGGFVLRAIGNESEVRLRSST